jgi:hypothetical protein
LRTLFPCCAPSLLPRHSVHIASDVTSVWRACCELVASMLRSTSKHQMQGWWAVGRASDFFPPSDVWSGALPFIHSTTINVIFCTHVKSESHSNAHPWMCPNYSLLHFKKKMSCVQYLPWQHPLEWWTMLWNMVPFKLLVTKSSSPSRTKWD